MTKNTSPGLAVTQEKTIPGNQPPRRWILAEEYSLRGWKDEPFFSGESRKPVSAETDSG